DSAHHVAARQTSLLFAHVRVLRWASGRGGPSPAASRTCVPSSPRQVRGGPERGCAFSGPGVRDPRREGPTRGKMAPLQPELGRPLRFLAGLVVVGGLLCAPRLVAAANTYYVAPTGSDANAGTMAAPFASWAKAQTVVSPGDTVYFR